MHAVAYGLVSSHSRKVLSSATCRLGLCVITHVCVSQTYVEFWPTQGEAAYGRFHVHLISEDPGDDFTAWTLALTNRQQVGSLHSETEVL